MKFAILVLLVLFISGCSTTTVQTASILPVPSKYDSWIVPTGNVQVVFQDGRKELWTSEGYFRDVLVSKTGSVGWIRIPKDNVDITYLRLIGKSVLFVRNPKGKVNTFYPPDECVGIEQWQFLEIEKAIIFSARGHHGPLSYAKYNVESGKLLDSIQGYTPYDQLPTWAQLVSDKRAESDAPANDHLRRP